jgi:sugar lactone lactonase YvrE
MRHTAVRRVVVSVAALSLIPFGGVVASADSSAPAPLARSITSISGYDDLADGRRLEDSGLSHPDGLAYDSAGNLYFVDFAYHIIRRVDVATRRVSTVVGNGRRGVDPGGTVVPTSVPIGAPIGLQVDRLDNLVFVNLTDQYVRYVNLSGHPATAYAVTIPAHKMAVIAGDGFGSEEGRFTGDGGPATQASFNFPRDIALDADGNAYVDDIHNLRTRRIDRTTGIITTVAGNGEFDQENSGDGGPATDASLLLPTGVAVDPDGGLVIAEYSGRLRHVDPDGTITTIAGNGEFAGGYGGDGGPAVDAQLGGNPKCPTFDADGSVLFTDPENHRIRRIDGASGIITTVVGSGFGDELYNDSAWSAADNGRHPTDVRLRYPQCLTLVDGGMVFTDGGNGAIRRVDAGADGLVNGDPTERLYEVANRGGIKQPFRIEIDDKNNVITVQNNRAQIVRVDPRGRVTPLVGTGVIPFSLDGPGGDPRDDLGDGGRAIDATVSPSSGISLSRDGDLYISDSYTRRIRRVRGNNGGVSPSSRIETVATLPFPADNIAVIDERHIYVSDLQDSRVWRVDGRTGRRTLIAGNGVEGLAGDGGPATEAEVGCPMGLALDASARHLFVASVCTGAVREVDLRSGLISTVVELSGEMYGEVRPGEPVQFAVLGDRFLFVTDGLLLTVRRVDLQSADRRADVVVGSGHDEFPGFTGDHVPGPQTQLSFPFGLAIDHAGKLYIAEQDGQRIRRLGMVDILPGKFPNAVSRRGRELVPVALLSTYAFDARRIDPASIRVAGAPVARTGNGKFRTSTRDVDGDQRPDLVVEVERSRMQLVGGAVEAAVTARTFGGAAFTDADWITLAG